MTANAPTGLIGHIDNLDIDGYGSVVDYLLENIPDLAHPMSVRTYGRMRHDPQLAAILQAYGGPIGRAHWTLDPAGARDEVVSRVADELGLPIKGADNAPKGARRRRFTFAEHLRIAGLYRVFGHMFFEQAYQPGPDGRWSLDVVQERMPQTIAAIHLNTDGTLKSIEQDVFSGAKNAPKITTADHRLVYYTRERQGSNYFGESLLRPSYGPWLIKDQMLRVHATSIRRFGMGVPGFEPLPGANPTPQMELAAQRVLGNMRASEHSHVVPPPGYRYVLTGMKGDVPDAVEFINYLDRQMTRSTLTSLLDMATAERGARSLGETVMDLMVLAQQADAEFIAATATSQLVVPLVDANWSEDETAPMVHVGDVGADVELTAQDMNWLMQYGGIQADQPARAWIRQRYGMPDEDPNYQPPDNTTGGAA